MKRLWQRIRGPLAQSNLAKNAIASVIGGALTFVRRTNRLVEGSDDPVAAVKTHEPAILAMWHGQHLLTPVFMAKGLKVTALVSRSADAELNALVAQRFGLEVVRGSGGREGVDHAKKGGARALIQLKRAMEQGSNVAMIADIPHGVPRSSGLGIITLAKLTGRPILPFAVATSRRKVLEKSWDKTTINLPFGRLSAVMGEPILVPADADEGEMEKARRQLTDALNETTLRAYQLADGRR
jgi:Uncharacterized protein conserved in bacteria